MPVHISVGSSRALRMASLVVLLAFASLAGLSSSASATHVAGLADCPTRPGEEPVCTPRDLPPVPTPTSILEDNYCRTQFCLPEFQGYGLPTEPLGNDNGQIGGRAAPVRARLDCDISDYITNVRADVSPNEATVGPLSPQAAIAEFLTSPLLPTGLVATSWKAEGLELPAGHYWSTYALPTKSGVRRLGVMRLEASRGFWSVSFMRACGEYLYPGSIVAAEVTS